MQEVISRVAALALGLVLAQSLQPASAASAAGGWDSAAGKQGEMVFVATGDSIINRRLSTSALPGVEQMFGLIRKADAAFTNFETQIHDFNLAPAQQSGGTYMGSPRFVTDELAWVGFDLLGLANNHANDYGVDGLRSTLAALSQTKFVYAGAGENLALARRPGYLDTPKGRVALISVAATFPDAIIAGAQRPDMRGRPGIDPLRHTTTYTVTQETYDTLTKLKGPPSANMGEGGGEDSKDGSLSWSGAKYVAGKDIGISTKANKRDLDELTAEVRNARQQADWVMVSIHAHESATPAERGKPAQFTVEFAHAMIDAGADMMIAHGPHVLRGIEVYKGKPILYSVGNFIFENDLVDLQPSDNYEKVGLGDDAVPADYYNKRTRNDTIGFPADRKFWQSVVAEMVFNTDRTLKAVRLHPISLGFGQPRIKRGQPYPAPAAEAGQIINDLQELCQPYGTTVEYKGGVGILSWK
ncbi:MAG TPA: CapA family protein [Steroidobacteraceae bacterium]|nr:CapA family protein [Steroidobacteraceae bacterium]